jgi:hypothetical protein
MVAASARCLGATERLISGFNEVGTGVGCVVVGSRQRLRLAGHVDANTSVNYWIATYPDVVFQVRTDDAHLCESRRRSNLST